MIGSNMNGGLIVTIHIHRQLHLKSQLLWKMPDPRADMRINDMILGSDCTRGRGKPCTRGRGKPKLTLDADFVSSCKALHELRSYKYLADGLKVAGQIGVAVGILRHALNYVQKKIPGEESWRLVFKQETDEVSALLRKYEHENEVVWYEKIPPHDELPIPEDRKSCVQQYDQIYKSSLVSTEA
ncbi:hypothetical protein Acr_27g0002420 [Actinidia rufa]|uniref:Uncharacterized protein n=1 Tax=Actinidia rufa TaxID=165716 RepID=A0A7J0H5X8_9ERIC|nr:hypothetical protein Acr_27g0002420 [Actinidia rufa]